MGMERCHVEGDRVSIHASRCGQCDLVAFPPERYGCERCGAPPSEHHAVSLGTDGEVLARATVHRHHRPDPPTPFTVIEILLDDGPALKALYVGEVDAAIGARVTGTVAGDRLAFRPAETP